MSLYPYAIIHVTFVSYKLSVPQNFTSVIIMADLILLEDLYIRKRQMGLKNYLWENIHSPSDINVHENECFCG